MPSMTQPFQPASSKPPQLRDAVVLTRAVEAVFRKLIRVLIGRISLKKLQELIQRIFVEESEAKLKLQSPDKNVALADLALLTGVDTRTIKKTRTDITRSDAIHKDDSFFDGFMPMFKVFNLWMNDKRFFDAQTGKPRALKLEGEAGIPGFSQLVKLALQSRGLTAQLVLKRLLDIDVVSIDADSGTIRLKQEDNIFISKADLDSIEVGFAAIGNLADTVSHNIQSNMNDEAKFFQRGCWDFQFSPEKMNDIRQAIFALLSEADGKARELIGSLSEPEPQVDQVTAGVGLFYFEEH